MTNSRQEKSERIRRLLAEIRREDISLQDLSDTELSDDDCLATDDDGLSFVSDVSSVASFKFSSPKREKSPRRKSRIPVPVKQRSPKVRIMKLEPPPHPPNFLSPNLSGCSKCTIGIFEGTGFPRSRIGERNTYVIVRLHPDLPVIRSPICFNRTTDAVYNGGFELAIANLDFSSVVPVVEVLDFLSDEESELIGVGYVQLQMSRSVGKVWSVLRDEWVGIVAVNTRAPCGRVRMSVIFHNDDDDVTELIRRRVRVENETGVEEEEERKKKVKETEKRRNDEGKAEMEEMAIQVTIGERHEQENNLFADLGLTFGDSSVRPWDGADIECPDVNRCQDPGVANPRPKMCFVGEHDLDESDDVVPVNERDESDDVVPVNERDESDDVVPVNERDESDDVVMAECQDVVVPGKFEPCPPRGGANAKRFASYADYKWE